MKTKFTPPYFYVGLFEEELQNNEARIRMPAKTVLCSDCRLLIIRALNENGYSKVTFRNDAPIPPPPDGKW